MTTPLSLITAARSTAATRAVLGLLVVTAVWGSTFFMLKGVITRVPVMDFLAVRFLLATIALWLIRPRAIRALTPAERRQGLLIGLFCGGAQVLQGIGLQSTSASVSGFVTGMYVVLTPVLGALVLGMHLTRTVWVAVGLSTLGMAVLSLQGFSLGGGELLTLLGAVLLAAQILALGRWCNRRNAYGLALIQLAVMTVMCAGFAVPSGLVLPSNTGDWLVLLYMALIAGAVAMLVQAWAQAHIAPTRAAIVMTMEPVWAAVFAVALGGEVLGVRTVLGGALVVAAMYLVELAPRRRRTAPSAPIREPAGSRTDACAVHRPPIPLA
jgi:drug/metabolite transporter (DMT)-like permease